MGILQRLFERDAKRTGKDGNIGIKIPYYLCQLGYKDIDCRVNDKVVFFNSKLGETERRELFESLRTDGFGAALNWSVKNQARMYLRNNHESYLSLDDAMRRWPETATAVGIKLTDQGRIDVIAPHGLEDLFELKLRQSKYCDDRAIFIKRIHDKKWLDRWKQLKIV